MTTFVSRDLEAGLREARRYRNRKQARYRVAVGEKTFPILRFEGNHFVMYAEEAPKLRGLVDIYDGAMHKYQALIVASNHHGSEIEFEFKRNTVPLDRPALDFEKDEDAPIGLIGYA